MEETNRNTFTFKFGDMKPLLCFKISKNRNATCFFLFNTLTATCATGGTLKYFT